jgi:hypothetical protein
MELIRAFFLTSIPTNPQLSNMVQFQGASVLMRVQKKGGLSAALKIIFKKNLI